MKEWLLMRVLGYIIEWWMTKDYSSQPQDIGVFLIKNQSHPYLII